VANGLVVGPLDAVVVWNFVIPLYPGKLEVVSADVAYPATRVTVLGLTQGENAPLRDAFLDWCRQSEVQEIFRRHGYQRGKAL
jgi:accessory colonization factor AcfC